MDGIFDLDACYSAVDMGPYVVGALVIGLFIGYFICHRSKT